MGNTTTTTEPAADVRKPSARQVYCAAHMMAELLGLAWPADRRQASELIGKLREAQAAHQAAQPATDEVPF